MQLLELCIGIMYSTSGRIYYTNQHETLEFPSVYPSYIFHSLFSTHENENKSYYLFTASEVFNGRCLGVILYIFYEFQNFEIAIKSTRKESSMLYIVLMF